jgi:fructose-specific component phosphotransferase system IIB-like protein
VVPTRARSELIFKLSSYPATRVTEKAALSGSSVHMIDFSSSMCKPMYTLARFSVKGKEYFDPSLRSTERETPCAFPQLPTHLIGSWNMRHPSTENLRLV